MEKQFDIIVVDGYWYVVDDVRPKEGEWNYDKVEHKVFCRWEKNTQDKNDFKVIASNNPSLTDIPLLPSVEQDVEQFALKQIGFSKIPVKGTEEWLIFKSYCSGFKAAQPKRFTIEDVGNILEKFHKMNMAYLTGKEDDNMDISEFLQSLQPVPKAVVLEYEVFPTGYFDSTYQFNKPKVVNNQVIVKRWIYE